MINSFGTGKPTEADGSGRGTGKRTEAAAAVRAVRLFGLFGCSGCSAVRAVRAAAALLPRMASGERSEAPTEAGATAAGDSSLFFFLVLLFLRLSPSAAAARALLPPNGQRRAERSPPPAESCSSAYLSLSFALSIISLSMKALLFECSCKILLANELILNVIVCVRPVEGLPVANRVPGVIFSLSIFIFFCCSTQRRPPMGRLPIVFCQSRPGRRPSPQLFIDNYFYLSLRLTMRKRSWHPGYLP